MDPQTHQRFLDYLELRGYFSKPNLPKLTQEEFTELDAELGRLLAVQERGEAAPEDIRKIVALRRMLFRD